MWEHACRIVKPSVAGVCRSYFVKGSAPKRFKLSGSAFVITRVPFPVLLTCAHVVTDGLGHPYNDLVFACNFDAEGPHQSSCRILNLNLDEDLALLEGGPEIRGPAITFNDGPLLPMGSAVAAIGFPLQSRPEISVDGSGSQSIDIRLAVGVVSGNNAFVRLPQTPHTVLDLKHYELNLSAYGGISGGPLFSQDGQIVGVMRGTKFDDHQTSSAYSWANRTPEIISYVRRTEIVA
jgi:Trypsin-like peptidase domain